MLAAKLPPAGVAVTDKEQVQVYLANVLYDSQPRQSSQAVKEVLVESEFCLLGVPAHLNMDAEQFSTQAHILWQLAMASK